MRLIRALFTLFAFLLLIVSVSAQEELGNLWNRSNQGMPLNTELQVAPSESRGVEDLQINYLFNTLNLPVIDDSMNAVGIVNFVHLIKGEI